MEDDMRTLSLTVGILTLSLSACSEANKPETATDALIADGKAIAEAQCAACHAIGAAGESPNAKAPVFRTILGRYSETALVDDLTEGIRIGHPDMPIITLRPEGTDALIAYLRSIQEKPD
jgi:mono/diheme cytochrome c family protein